MTTSLWIYLDVGFDTSKGIWVLALHDAKGNGTGTIVGRSVELRNCTSFQYSWPDGNLETERNFWHIRQRILPEYVSKITYEGDSLIIEGIRGIEPISETPFPLSEEVASIEMAYSLGTSKGFVELLDKDGKVIKEIKGRLIITENLNMRTVGTYPHIRLHADRKDVHGLVITGTTCTIVGVDNH